jgi:hypothetical protein
VRALHPLGAAAERLGCLSMALPVVVLHGRYPALQPGYAICPASRAKEACHR